MVRSMDRQGEVLIWCRMCSGYARQRMGPKLVNCCRPEQTDTKESKLSRKEESLPRRQRIGESREKKKRNTRKGYQRLLNNFEMEGSMAQIGLWNFGKEKQ